MPLPNEILPGEILVVRHAAADQPRGYLDGPADPALTALGEWQADDLGRYLCRLSLDAIVTSPMQRALTTAERAADISGLTVVKEDDLRELDWGPYAGWPQKDAFKGARIERLESDGLDGRLCRGSESYRDVAARVRDVLARYQHEQVLFLTHGSAIKGVVGVELDWSRTQTRKYPVGNAEVLAFNPELHQKPRRLFFPEVA